MRTNPFVFTAIAVLVVLASVFGAVQGTSIASDCYVSTTGSDSNDGSTAHPWKTIAHADSLAQPGWTIHVAPGTYTGNFSTKANGTATRRITFISDTKYGAILKPTPGTRSDHWNTTNSYVTIQGFEFDGSGSNSSDAIAQYPGLGQHDLWIIGDKFHDYATGCNNHSGAVISLGLPGNGNVSHNLVYGNLMYHNNCGQAGSIPASDGQHGIYCDAKGDTIQNNVIVDQGGGWCIQAWGNPGNWTVTNNTLVNCGQGGIVVSKQSGNHSNDTITNNIVVNQTGPSGGIDLACGAGASNDVIQNNLMYGNTHGNYVGTCDGATLGNTQTGSNSATFVSYTGDGRGDYHLKSGSTGINNGTTVCASGMSPCVPTQDYDGIHHPQGSAYAIGAYGYLGTRGGGSHHLQ